MNIGFLFPTIKSDFHFKRLEISNGIFLIDIVKEKIGINNKNNVGILILPDLFKNIPLKGGASDIEKVMDAVLLFLFLKTKRTFSVNECYEVKFYKNETLKLVSEKSIDFFSKYALLIWSYENFLFGTDRHNLFTKNLFRVVEKERNFFENYFCLQTAQLYPDSKTPLGVAMNAFVAAFANNGQDDPKFVLILTALEALFSTSSSEITFRLSSNIAWFLNPAQNDYEGRRYRFEEIRKLYDARSQIVHGRYREIKAEEYDSILDLFVTIIQMMLENYKLTHIFLNRKKHTEFIKKIELGYLDRSL